MKDINNKWLKDKEGVKFTAQLKKVYKAFFNDTFTMLEVEKITGIRRENICRYVAIFRKSDNIFFIRKRKCTASGYDNVCEFTTNPDLAMDIYKNQLKLF